MASTMAQPAAEVLSAFDFGGEIAGALRYGQGHINDTFAVYVQRPDGDARRFILQRINTEVFTNPGQLMENIAGVTSFLRKKIIAAGGDPERETLTVVPTRDGRLFYTDAEGGAWRCYPFIEGGVCLQKAETPDQFAAAGRSFGRFLRLLEDYPADTLHETIEKFHDTRDRLKKFLAALEADALGRAKDVPDEIQFVLDRQADCAVLMDQLEAGRLPLRVTHNDTKLNNIILDKRTGEGLCVIDLDTIMPGLALNDYGDSIRFGATTAAEDEPDLSKVHFDLGLYGAYTRGYLEAAGSSLTPAEKENLPWGAKLMTLECGIRFLTDYLEGDTYFKIHRPGQNLDRCRTQFKLVADMEREWQAMHEIVKECGQ
ncbi:MAG TPA: aminoglycoside phosphotransferase family protein [Firmicutes bacterium]|nr:aminoglycoside phosphotransferase family protein [Bacillota bacterium]